MNLFNALNGKEAKQAIINEVTRALENDSEFREHLTFPRVSWHWKLEMKIYPRTPEEKVLETSGEAVQIMVERGTDGLLAPVPDATGAPIPVVKEDESHTRLVINSQPREVTAPDAVREAEGIPSQMARPGGVRTARAVEVGKASEKPTLSPGLNR